MSIRRFTIRFLFVVVALAAVVVWGLKMWDRSAVFAQTAERHGGLMNTHIGNIEIYEHDRIRSIRNHPPDFWVGESKKGLDVMDAHIAAYRRDAEYEESLYRKYRRAAHFPWLSVGADPPPPQPSGADMPWIYR